MSRMTPPDAIARGIRVIYQDFAVFPNLTVAENIALNTEIAEGVRLVNDRRRRELALTAMEKIGAGMDPDARLDTLPAAGRQLTALCRAIVREPKLLIMDEPTTALTAREVEKLWDVVKKLRDKGIAVLLVDHKFDEIRQIADRLTVIRNGEVISSGPVSAYDHRRFRIDLTGHDFAAEKYAPPPSEEVILSAEGLTCPGKYEDVSFTMHRGDVIGITGLLGSGRNEIAEAFFGLCPPVSGRIVLNGREIRLRSVRDARRHEIGFVPEDRLTEGLFTGMTVTENIAASSLKKYIRRHRVSFRRMREDSLDFITRLGIRTSSPEAAASSLSGGNAQKVVLAKWLNTAPRLLVLIGPSVGMDVGAKAEIHAILHELAGQGVGILMVTDDLGELTENCNKILIVRDHRIIRETDNTVSKKQIERYMMGDGGEEVMS